MTRIEIDPNVRVHGNRTFSGFENVDGPIAVGQPVAVYESEGGLSGQGTVISIDEGRQLVYLNVDWSALSWEPVAPVVSSSISQPTSHLVFVSSLSTIFLADLQTAFCGQSFKTFLQSDLGKPPTEGRNTYTTRLNDVRRVA